MNKDDFLGRWSKRKLDVEHNAAEETVLKDVPDDVPLELAEEDGGDLVAVEPDDATDAEEHEPHPAEGIDIDTLEYDSDFTVFMKDKVPKTLKRMALRKLWLSNPILANVDGLNDYDEDFTDAATVFINSAGDVISGTRDQIWDNDQISQDKDEIAEDESDEEVETEAAEAEVEDEDVEVAEEEHNPSDDAEHAVKTTAGDGQGKDEDENKNKDEDEDEDEDEETKA